MVVCKISLLPNAFSSFITSISEFNILVISGCHTYKEPVSPEKDTINPQVTPNQRCIFRISLLKDTVMLY